MPDPTPLTEDRTCSGCGESKPRGEFPKKGARCKVCRRESDRRSRAANPESQRAAGRRYRERHREAIKAQKARWDADNREKRRAHHSCDVCDSTGWVPAEGAREGERPEALDQGAITIASQALAPDEFSWRSKRDDLEADAAECVRTYLECAARAPEQLLDEARERKLLTLVERLYEERNRNCEIATGLAERIHHERDDYGAYVRAMDELVGDDDAEVDAALAAASPNPMDGEGR